MKLLKGALKVAGSAALGVGWLASGVIRNAADAAGSNILSDLADMGVNATANKIKDIWNVESNEINIDEDDLEIAELQRMKSRKRQAATRCRDMAYAAEKVGNTEKYEMFMQQYESLMDEVSSYDEEISKAKLEKI